MLSSYIERIIWGKNGTPWMQCLKPILYLLSLIYGATVRMKIFLYRHGFLHLKSLPCKVISLGNITVGGTGKTPMAIWLAEFLTSEGIRVAILSRGYRGTTSHTVNTVSDGRDVFSRPHDVGDEPILMARRLKGVPVLTSQNRFRAGQHAISHFGAEILILDDGFQHMTLKRDMDFVLLDATNLLGNGYLLPRGPLREPVSHLKRAHAFILTRCDQAGNIEKITSTLSNTFPKIPVFKSVHRPYKLCTLGEHTFLDVGVLSGSRILAFSGIANARAFMAMLKSIGLDVVQFKEYPDHYNYSRKELQHIQREALALNVEAIITTEKDVVRIEDRWSNKLPLSFLAINMEFVDEAFKNFLMKHLKQL